MKSITFVLVLAAAAFAETQLGKPLQISTSVPVSRLMVNPEPFAGKAVQVTGKVSEVCSKMGCWMQLTDGDKALRVKVIDGDIVFPKSTIGKRAVAEGTLKKFELTRDQVVAQAKHYAEEQGTKFDPSSIKSGRTYWQIQGTGAVVLD